MQVAGLQCGDLAPPQAGVNRHLVNQRPLPAQHDQPLTHVLLELAGLLALPLAVADGAKFLDGPPPGDVQDRLQLLRGQGTAGTRTISPLGLVVLTSGLRSSRSFLTSQLQNPRAAAR